MPPDDASRRANTSAGTVTKADSKAGTKPDTRLKTAKGCPVCGKPVEAASRPFCSERCRNVDLGRWLSGSYVIPASDEEDEGEPFP